MAVCLLPEDTPAGEWDALHTHPRIGRCVFFSRSNRMDFFRALEQADEFRRRRETHAGEDSTSCPYSAEQISPRWLFESMMMYLDEYIYFKDDACRFLAVSQYLVEQCERKDPSEILGKDDFSFFDERHAREAFADEMKIVGGELSELDKEEAIDRRGEEHWVSSRKFPLRTRSGYVAGSFGISRDITEAKVLRQALEKSNEQMRAELEMAKSLQRTLLDPRIAGPGDTTGHDGVEFEAKYLPSFHLSGDFYSIRTTPSGRLGLLIADVMGHGVRSAMVTAMMRIAVQQLEKHSDKPADFLARLNQVIYRSLNATEQTIFATALYGTVDPRTGEFLHAEAGAHHAMLCGSGDAAEQAPLRHREPGPALGLFPDGEYEASPLSVGPDDTLLLFTDGVTEASDANGEEFGEARLRAFLAKNERETLLETMDALLAEVRLFTGTGRLEDDICLVGLRRTS